MDLNAQIRADADRCVLCGLCLPLCPTYRLSHDEAESPRGRISLLQALAAGQLEPSASLRGHIERCLSCRACEAFCPSRVPYARLLRHGRELLAAARPQPQRFAFERLTDPAARQRSRKLGRLYQKSGLARLARHLPLGETLSRASTYLPLLPPALELPAYLPAEGETRGAVGLFVGCTGELLDQAVLKAALSLLPRFGYAVHIPPGQGCCGGLHLQQGAGEKARQMARANLESFRSQKLDAIVGFASGCSATLSDYPDLLGAEAAGFAVQDIVAFLADQPWPTQLEPAPLAQRVAVHEPCSLRNVLRRADAAYTLLSKIPRLEVVPLAGNDQCCGAAGAYLLEQPETAARLRADKLEALRTLSPATLVSSNIGCALHLAAGCREAGLRLEVMHPLTLLARQVTSDK